MHVENNPKFVLAKLKSYLPVCNPYSCTARMANTHWYLQLSSACHSNDKKNCFPQTVPRKCFSFPPRILNLRLWVLASWPDSWNVMSGVCLELKLSCLTLTACTLRKSNVNGLSASVCTQRVKYAYSNSFITDDSYKLICSCFVAPAETKNHK